MKWYGIRPRAGETYWWTQRDAGGNCYEIRQMFLSKKFRLYVNGQSKGIRDHDTLQSAMDAAEEYMELINRTEETNMNRIYLLYTCNEWKEHSSMNLRMASSKRTTIERSILKGIEEGDFCYGGEDTDKDEQLARFHTDCAQCRGIDYINGLLKYGHIDFVKDGEEQ